MPAAQGPPLDVVAVPQADEVVHKYEEHLIRRVADLLHVSHREFIVAKLRSSST